MWNLLTSNSCLKQTHSFCTSLKIIQMREGTNIWHQILFFSAVFGQKRDIIYIYIYIYGGRKQF